MKLSIFTMSLLFCNFAFAASPLTITGKIAEGKTVTLDSTYRATNAVKSCMERVNVDGKGFHFFPHYEKVEKEQVFFASPIVQNGNFALSASTMPDSDACDSKLVNITLTFKDLAQNVLQLPLYNVSDKAMLTLDHVSQIVDISEVAKIVVEQDNNSLGLMPRIYLKDGSKLSGLGCILIDYSNTAGAVYNIDIE